MKKIILLVIIGIMILSCKSDKKEREMAIPVALTVAEQIANR